MRTVVIHASANIGWHDRWADAFAAGLRRAGIEYRNSRSGARSGEGVPLLLGTTMWRAIETDGGPYILVDRCSFGDKDRNVSLVWNGHGRRGDHKVPAEPDGARWGRSGLPMKPWRRGGKRVVLCGQTETYSPHYPTPETWYVKVRHVCTHFRAHPDGYNPTNLPTVTDWRDTKLAVTLNSSVGVQAVLDGVPTVTMDEGAMAWDVTSHDLEAPLVTPDRAPWCRWLAYTQWSDDEVRDGTPWEQLWA